jgi:hypothetical protein
MENWILSMGPRGMDYYSGVLGLVWWCSHDFKPSSQGGWGRKTRRKEGREEKRKEKVKRIMENSREVKRIYVPQTVELVVGKLTLDLPTSKFLLIFKINILIVGHSITAKFVIKHRYEETIF